MEIFSTDRDFKSRFHRFVKTVQAFPESRRTRSTATWPGNAA